MSAFIVSDKTIASIVSFCRRGFMGGGNGSFAQNRFSKYYTEKTGFQENKLANDLIRMNYRAYIARYGGVPSHLFQGKISGGYSKLQVLKSARCLLYQCNERNVPQEPLYQALENFIHDLSYEIIGELPEYEAAQWDIE